MFTKEEFTYTEETTNMFGGPPQRNMVAVITLQHGTKEWELPNNWYIENWESHYDPESGRVVLVVEYIEVLDDEDGAE